MSRPRWTIFVSGKPGPDRLYLFQDNDPKPQEEKEAGGVCLGKSMHFFNGGFTAMKDPEDAIVFCDFLNQTKPSHDKMSDDLNEFGMLVPKRLAENLAADNARLKAEVERLRKAGDAVCESPYALETDPAVIEWRAAKEGKQP